MFILSEKCFANLKLFSIDGHNANVLCVGSPGTGKDEQFIVPNILNSQDNLIVFDLENELYDRSAYLADCHNANAMLQGKFIYKFVIGDNDHTQQRLWIDVTKKNDIRRIPCFSNDNPSHGISAASVDFIVYPTIHKTEPADAVSIILKNIIKRGSRTIRHVDIILNKFANIGTIPDLANNLETLHRMKADVSVIICTQSVSQIYALYGRKDGSRIIRTCGIKLFMGGDDADNRKMMGIEPVSHADLNNDAIPTCFIKYEEEGTLIEDKKCPSPSEYTILPHAANNK